MEVTDYFIWKFYFLFIYYTYLIYPKDFPLVG